MCKNSELFRLKVAVAEFPPPPPLQIKQFFNAIGKLDSINCFDQLFPGTFLFVCLFYVLVVVRLSDLKLHGRKSSILPPGVNLKPKLMCNILDSRAFFFENGISYSWNGMPKEPLYFPLWNKYLLAEIRYIRRVHGRHITSQDL